MGKKKRHRLATGELEIMEMLWREGPVSLSKAHESLGQPVGYTTVQTRLNRLVAKGVVQKSNTRPAEYEAACSRQQVFQNDLDVLLKRVSAGKVVPLVAHLVQDRELSAEEIHAIRELIDKAEQSIGKRSRS